MKYIYFALLTVLTIFSIEVVAQNEIAPEKKKVIAEIIIATKASEKVEETMSQMMKQMQAAYPAIIRSTLAGMEGLDANQKATLETELINKNEKFTVKFQERLRQRINYKEFIEQTIYPLYDKFFTESELKDLLSFYKTSTGQKLNEIMPQMVGESVRLSQELLVPKITGIVNEIIQEDIKETQTPKQKVQ
jgi:uncharacterized protein